MNPNIISHLKERLRQRELRQQITRSKSITPIIDSINAAAKLEGLTGDDIVADYVSGKHQHPVISAALSKPTEADLDRMQKASLAAKKHREDAFEATRRKYAEQSAIIKKQSTKPSATAAAPATAETERDRLHREMAAITDPVQRRAFRLRNWNKLSKQFSNPEPRK
jgi:hypothetical protein